MKSRRSRYISNMRMVSVFGSAFIVMGTLFILPNTAGAQVRSINMPEEMCDVLREEPLNQRILTQIRNRADFAEILEYVEETCGDLSGLLIGPTGSINTPPARDNRNGGNNVIQSSIPSDGGDDGGNGDDSGSDGEDGGCGNGGRGDKDGGGCGS